MTHCHQNCNTSYINRIDLTEFGVHRTGRYVLIFRLLARSAIPSPLSTLAPFRWEHWEADTWANSVAKLLYNEEYPSQKIKHKCVVAT